MFCNYTLPLPPNQQPNVYSGDSEYGDGDYAGADVFDPFDLDIPFWVYKITN